MAKSKVLGVLGGLGPMATVHFYELVTAHTLVLRDQDHIDMVISSKASTPDRTAYILGKSKENPFLVMEDEAHRLVDFGAEVMAMPCNTAHYFHQRLEDALPVPVLNMVQETVARIRTLGGNKAGILATDGTIQSETYQKECKAQGLSYAIPCEASQQKIMRIIYDDVKRGQPPNRADFFAVSEELFAEGCDHLILGCTELSLLKKTGVLDTRFLDSMEVLAEHAILACGRTPTGFVWE